MRYSDLMVANEGFFKDQIEYENWELIRTGLPVKVYTYDTEINKILKRLSIKARYSGHIVVHWDGFIAAVQCKNFKILNCPKELYQKFETGGFTNDDTLMEALSKLTKICQNYTNNTGQLVFIIMMPGDYCYQLLEETPMVLLNCSYLTSFLSGIRSLSAQRVKTSSFNQQLSGKLSKKYFVNPKGLTLYHVSPIEGIETLEPRKTHRPFNDFENIRIARISCSDNIDGCYRGAQFNLKSKKSLRTYIYQLKLTPNSIVVKPDKYLVPDVDVSNEYWVLTPTRVSCIGAIDITLTNDYKYEYHEIKEYKKKEP